MPLFSGRCYSNAKLIGKTAIVTGCNTGIGKETVRDFYKRGAKVIMACRNLSKAEEAKNDIVLTCKDTSEKGQIVVEKCDLSSLNSVREFSKKVLESEPYINILVNNAGVMMCPKELTEDGFEVQFGINHLAHFLLTMLLLPKIKNSTPARIVTVTSMAHSKYNMNLDDINFDKRPYSSMEAYSQSKLANVLFTKELSKRLKDHNIEGVNTYCLHPGVVRTELGRHLDKTLFRGARRLIGFIFYPFMKSPETGAQTSIYCAVDEKCANETGLYYSDCVAINPDQKALDGETAQRLWDKSVELVGLEFDPFTSDAKNIFNKK